jgi:CRP-like cAMP-binding protein
MVGGSRQSVNHILKTFEARGFLSVRGREVVILDPDALRARGAR